jgi:hypothetical protein
VRSRLAYRRVFSRKARGKRACMCCGTTFMSEGAHNRLCDVCRKNSPGLFESPARTHYR